MKNFNWTNRKILYYVTVLFVISNFLNTLFLQDLFSLTFNMMALMCFTGVAGIYPILTLINYYNLYGALVSILPQKEYKTILKEFIPWICIIILSFLIHLVTHWNNEYLNQYVWIFIVKIFDNSIFRISTSILGLFLICMIYRRIYNIKASILISLSYNIISTMVVSIYMRNFNLNQIIGVVFGSYVIESILVFIVLFYVIKKYEQGSVINVIRRVHIELNRGLKIIKDKVFLILLVLISISSFLEVALQSIAINGFIGFIVLAYSLYRFIRLLKKKDLYIWITNKSVFSIWGVEILKIALLWIIYFIPRLISVDNRFASLDIQYSYLTCLIMCLLYISLFNVYNNSNEYIFNKCLMLIAIAIAIASFSLESITVLGETEVIKVKINGALIASFMMIIYKTIIWIWDKIIIESFNMRFETKKIQ